MFKEPAFAGSIRFFCPINDTPLSAMAMAYTEAFLALNYKVRVLSTKVAQLAALSSHAWIKHRGLFLTPIEAPFVNVVCGEPFDWHRLYTVNVKNVLVAGSPPAPDAVIPGLRIGTQKLGVLESESAIAAQVAARYDVIVVPTVEISLQWRAFGLVSVVVPMEVGSHASALRSALSDSHRHEQPSQPPP